MNISLEKISRVKPSNSLTEAGTLRKRAQRACRQCHSQKTKCSGDLPRCKRCETSGLSCEYPAAKRKFAIFRIDAQTCDDTPSPAAPKVATPTPPTRTASLPSKSEQSASPADAGSTGSVTTGNFPLTIDISVLTAQYVPGSAGFAPVVVSQPLTTVHRELLARKNFILKHLDAYFENIYWLPCMGFFHPETAYRQVYVGRPTTSFLPDPAAQEGLTVPRKVISIRPRPAQCVPLQASSSAPVMPLRNSV